MTSSPDGEGWGGEVSQKMTNDDMMARGGGAQWAKRGV